MTLITMVRQTLECVSNLEITYLSMPLSTLLGGHYRPSLEMRKSEAANAEVRADLAGTASSRTVSTAPHYCH